LNLLLLQAENRAVEINILPAGQVLMEARAQLQQRADATAHRNPALGGPQNPGDELQRRALATTVAADDAQAFAPVKVEAEVTHCPKLLFRAPLHTKERNYRLQHGARPFRGHLEALADPFEADRRQPGSLQMKVVQIQISFGRSQSRASILTKVVAESNLVPGPTRRHHQPITSIAA